MGGAATGDVNVVRSFPSRIEEGSLRWMSGELGISG
jgi:hypothetical protein